MKRHLLFVDDNAETLSALRAMTLAMEPEWRMSFAASGAEALDCLHRETIQVVIAEIRVAGGEVLGQARELQPGALRIALTGPADRELLAASLGVIHQALPRPFNLEQLVAMVANAGHIGHGDVDPELQRLLGRMENLPSVPKLYRELCEVLEGEGATVRQVSEIIRRDMGMTAKILQLVNSAFFGLRRTVEDIQDAVAFLGTETIKALVLVHGVFDQTGELGTRNLSIVDLWVHSLNVSKGARALAAMEGLSRVQCAEAFMGGMLHDVGILVLAKQFPERYDRVAERLLTESLSIPLAEREEFGVTHPEVGAFLLGLWGIQPGVLKIVSLHHTPSNLQALTMNSLLAVHVADFFSGKPGHPTIFDNSRLDDAAIDALGLRDRIAGWRQVLSQSGW